MDRLLVKISKVALFGTLYRFSYYFLAYDVCVSDSLELEVELGATVSSSSSVGGLRWHIWASLSLSVLWLLR